MKASPEIETKGLQAYERARAFESLQRKRLPLLYGGFTILLLTCAGLLLRLDHALAATFFLLLAIAFPVLAWLHWRRMGAHHAENLLLLAELENVYGEDLPWIQVERHFAALERLQAELKQEEGA